MVRESVDHWKESIQLLKESVNTVDVPEPRSKRAIRNRSDSYAGSFCIRYAMNLPSGEYFGLPSYARLDSVIFRGFASALRSESTHKSLLVDEAGVLSRLDTNTISELSGAKSYCTGPPS